MSAILIFVCYLFFLHILKTTKKVLQSCASVVKCNLGNSRQKRVNYLYPDLAYKILFFFLMFQDSFFFLLLPVWKTFSILSGKVFWQQVLSVFLHLKMSWFPLPSWRLFLLDIGFWVENSFLSAFETCCAMSSGISWFLMIN